MQLCIHFDDGAKRNGNQSSIVDAKKALSVFCFVFFAILKLFVLSVQSVPNEDICAVVWIYLEFIPLSEMLAVELGCY